MKRKAILIFLLLIGVYRYAHADKEDTEWKTFKSSYGFTIRIPPSWSVYADDELAATLDGASFNLIQLTPNLHEYELPQLSPGLHILEVKAYISGQQADDAIAYVDIVPKSSTGGATQ